MQGAATEHGKAFDWEVSKRILGYLRPYKRNVWIAVAGMMISVLSTIAGPPLIGYAVDHGLQENDLGVAVGAAVAYMLTQVAGFLGFRVQLFQMAIAGQSTIKVLREQLFTHVQRLALSFFPTYENGRIIARIIGDVNVLREAITFSAVGVFRDIFIVLGILITMLLIDPRLTLIAFGVVFILGVFANFWRVYARRAYIKVREANADVNAELAENFNAIRVVQAFAREAFNYERFTGSINRRNLDANLEATWTAALFFPSIDLVGGVATGVLIYVGGLLILEGQISAFKLITFVLYIEQFFFPIRMLAQRYNTFQATMAAGEKIFWILDRPIEIKDAPGALPLPKIQGHIRFEDVRLDYIPDQPVLDNFNLQIPAGATVALVGHTGAGKSTIIKLLSRFYDVTAGRVCIDGQDVRQVTLESLRSQVGVVLQQNFLFAGSILENIRYGRLNASDEEVIAAAQSVGAHDFITQLDRGYQTEIEEGGARLSVGQRQLLAFARALLADPRILILDEATSNIDTRTEQIIQAALHTLLAGRTSVVIAHRLSTIVNADMIVVMDHGQVKESGTHQELLALRGVYYRLYTMTYGNAGQAA
jgi:ABC-type multidrug transport system fused ATPase/permease subunit